MTSIKIELSKYRQKNYRAMCEYKNITFKINLLVVLQKFLFHQLCGIKAQRYTNIILQQKHILCKCQVSIHAFYRIVHTVVYMIE